MAEFSLRRAEKEDVPAIFRLCKDTIVEVYGPFIPGEILRPWAEGSAVENLGEEPWPRKTVAVAERGASIVDSEGGRGRAGGGRPSPKKAVHSLRFISSSRRGDR